MKKMIILVAFILLFVACSDERTTNPESVETFFRAEALHVELIYINVAYLDECAWELHSRYDYELEGSAGKIHTHTFYFKEIDMYIVKDDSDLADCCEPEGMKLQKYITGLMLDDYFAGLDSVTVYFSLEGAFQDCSGGTADSIGAISWSRAVRAEVIDTR